MDLCGKVDCFLKDSTIMFGCLIAFKSIKFKQISRAMHVRSTQVLGLRYFLESVFICWIGNFIVHRCVEW